jgi:hypothetical protein
MAKIPKPMGSLSAELPKQYVGIGGLCYENVIQETQCRLPDVGLSNSGISSG